MQKENNLAVGQWCDHWFTANRHKWNSNTEGGYRNLIYSHIIPSIGSVAPSDLKQRGIGSFPTTRCGSAGSPRQRNTKQPLCDWGSSSVT